MFNYIHYGAISNISHLVIQEFIIIPKDNDLIFSFVQSISKMQSSKPIKVILALKTIISIIKLEIDDFSYIADNNMLFEISMEIFNDSCFIVRHLIYKALVLMFDENNYDLSIKMCNTYDFVQIIIDFFDIDIEYSIIIGKKFAQFYKNYIK